MSRRIIGALTAFALSVPAIADVDARIGDDLWFDDYTGTLAGSYLAHNPAQGNEFLTFCAEVEEVLIPSQGFFSYNVDSIGTVSVSGGRTLTEQTAWLFSSFRDGTLSGYDGGSNSDRDALQYGIWQSLGYTDPELITLGVDIAAARTAYLSSGWGTDFTSSGWVGLGNVRIANLSLNLTGDRAQDVLVIIPAPAAALLGAIGVGMLVWVKRRRAIA